MLRTVQDRSRDADIRASMRAAVTGWSREGTVSVRAPQGVWEAELETASASRIHVELDGLISEAPSRAATAESLAGHLGGLLAGSLENVVILGDDLGEAAASLLMHHPGQVRVATPFPHATRAIASLNPEREADWLRPSIQLIPAHPELVLRTTARADAIIEIARVPWADGARSIPQADRVARRLTDSGVYVLCIHLSWWDAGVPQAIVADVAATFDHVQLWLPPEGADTLLVVASPAPLSLSRLQARALPPILSDLEMRVPLDLASLALADRDIAQEWSAEHTPHEPWHLPGTLFTRPHLHIGALADATVEPGAIWSMADVPEAVTPLQERLDTRRSLLGLLGEAASGNMAGVFERADEIHGSSLSVQTLDPLIDPHLDSALNAIKEASADGPGSPKWDTAARFATTARMLSPDSPRPLIAMGRIAAGQFNFEAAKEHFTGALEREPGNLRALTALAQIEHRLSNFTEAERLMKEAIAANPQSWPAYLNLGTFMMARQRFEDAEKNFRRAASLSSGQEPGPHIGLAETYLRLEQPVRALAEAELACQQNGGGFAWFLRGRAHFELEQFDQAEEDFQRAVLIDPTLIQAHGAYAQIRALRGDMETARESYRLILSKDPGNAAARENLRRLELEMNAAGANP